MRVCARSRTFYGAGKTTHATQGMERQEGGRRRSQKGGLGAVVVAIAAAAKARLGKAREGRAVKQISKQASKAKHLPIGTCARSSN